MLLAFDTCLDKTYIALSDYNSILDGLIIENEGNTYHSAFLISNIKNILKRNNLTPQNLTAIATDIGPGSFTGIRACMTVAKVMAQQLNLKTYGISSLEILSKFIAPEKTPLVLLDARKNKVYVWDKKIFGALPLEDVKEKVSANQYSIIADEQMFEIFSPICSDITSYTNSTHNIAEFLIDIAKNKTAIPLQDLKPLYIQPPPIFGK